MSGRQSQEGGEGSQNYQAGRDIVLSSISVTEAREIALDVFRANSLELRGIAQEIALARAEKITRDFLDALLERAPEAINSAADPDMQWNVFIAQRDFARSGEEDLERALVDLLVDRASRTDRDLRTLVLNDAIAAVSKLTREERAAIAVTFLVRYTRYGGPADLMNFATNMKRNFEPFIDLVPTRVSPYQHMASVGVGSIDAAYLGFIDGFQTSYPGYFTHGFAQGRADANPEMSPVAHFNNRSAPIPDLAPLIDNPSVFIPALRNPENMQLNAMTSEDVSTLVSALPSDLEHQLRSVVTIGQMTPDEMRLEFSRWSPSLESAERIWRTSPLSQFALTATGIAIGHSAWQSATGQRADLGAWI
jgi:hypothetical protein